MKNIPMQQSSVSFTHCDNTLFHIATSILGVFCCGSYKHSDGGLGHIAASFVVSL